MNGGEAGVRGDSEAFVEGVVTREGIGEPSVLEVGAAAVAAAGCESGSSIELFREVVDVVVIS